MFRKFYTTAMSESAKQLERRFLKLRQRPVKSARPISCAAAAVCAAIGITATAVFASVDGNISYGENAGAIYTFYEYPGDSMEYNVRARLRESVDSPASSEMMHSRYSSPGWSSVRCFTPICLANLTDYYLIDDSGSMVDIYNRKQPHYAVIKYWLTKDQTNDNWDHFERTEFRTMDIAGKELTVCFADRGADYADDEVIRRMIQKQIEFELSYVNPYYEYDHKEYISQLMEWGVYVIRGVFPKEEIQSWSWFGGNYGDFTEEPIIEDNINNRIIQENRAETAYSGDFLVPENVDGNQARKLCEVTVDTDESLIIDIKRATDNMPYVNYKLIAKYGLPYYSQQSMNGSSVQPGEAAETFIMNPGGMRRNYLPFNNTGQPLTYEIWVSGPECDYADIEVYTCRIGGNGPFETSEKWVDMFTYDNPYGLMSYNEEDAILWGA